MADITLPGSDAVCVSLSALPFTEQPVERARSRGAPLHLEGSSTIGGEGGGVGGRKEKDRSGWWSTQVTSACLGVRGVYVGPGVVGTNTAACHAASPAGSSWQRAASFLSAASTCACEARGDIFLQSRAGSLYYASILLRPAADSRGSSFISSHQKKGTTCPTCPLSQ